MDDRLMVKKLCYNILFYQCCNFKVDLAKPQFILRHGFYIITLVRHKKPDRQQNAWFDTEMLDSTQNCPTQHASVDIAIIPPPY